jgi:hypothetical protein
MSLGLVASAASVLRLVYTSKFVSLNDPLYDIDVPAIWGIIEEFLGIIAACVPFLRVPFERLLGKVGLLTHGNATRSQRITYQMYPLDDRNRTGMNSAHAKQIIKPESPFYGFDRSTEVLCIQKT